MKITKETHFILINSKVTNSKIGIAFDQKGILYSAIKHPNTPVWFEEEIHLLYNDFESVSYKILNTINDIKKIFSGSKVIKYFGNKGDSF